MGLLAFLLEDHLIDGLSVKATAIKRPSQRRGSSAVSVFWHRSKTRQFLEAWRRVESRMKTFILTAAVLLGAQASLADLNRVTLAEGFVSTTAALSNDQDADNHLFLSEDGSFC